MVRGLSHGAYIHAIGDTTKPLPVGYGAKFFDYKPEIKKWAWPNSPMSETAEFAREMTAEEIAKEEAEDKKLKDKVRYYLATVVLSDVLTCCAGRKGVTLPIGGVGFGA